MSATSRYHARAPRYVLRAEDQSTMRFAQMDTRGVSTPTKVHDLSESGLSFTLSRSHGYAELPEEGEMLKIEFTVPGRKQIACFATVVRVEPIEVWSENGEEPAVKIAIQFRNLPLGHRRALQLGLAGRARDEDALEHRPAGALAVPSVKETALFCLASGALLGAFYAMVTPPLALGRLLFGF